MRDEAGECRYTAAAVARLFADALTVRHLRGMAGSAFARGEAYWRDGHVVSISVSEDAIDGVVVGGERYHVRLSMSSGFLSASCTCPVGALMCKHSVAVGLAYLHQDAMPHAQPTLPMAHGLPAAHGLPMAQGRLVPHGQSTAHGVPAAHGMTAAESGRTASTSAGWRFDGGGTDATGENGFAARKDLEAWAAEHDVKHALWVSAESLIPRLPAEDVQRYGLRYLLSRLAVRDVGSRD